VAHQWHIFLQRSPQTIFNPSPRHPAPRKCHNEFPVLQVMALIGGRGHSGSKHDARRWTFAVLVVIEMAGLWERVTGRQRRARKAERQAAEQAWAAEWECQARPADPPKAADPPTRGRPGRSGRDARGRPGLQDPGRRDSH
jgi:hypothetical protein